MQFLLRFSRSLNLTSRYRLYAAEDNETTTTSEPVDATLPAAPHADAVPVINTSNESTGGASVTDSGDKIPLELEEEEAIHIQHAREAGYEIPNPECGMCQFIRRGPCYKEYFAYDKCHRDQDENQPADNEPNRCIPLFAAMYECMKQPENLWYYQPMVEYFDEVEEKSKAPPKKVDPLNPPVRVWHYDEKAQDFNYRTSDATA